MTRKALGRGLDALLGSTSTSVQVPPAGLEQVPIDQIDANPLQPRRTFQKEKLDELAASIQSSGVVQPVLLRRAEGRYQLVAGERRWRAARAAGLTVIPAVVRDIADREALELALTENLLREDLNPLEAARGYQALHDDYGLSHEEIATQLGLDRSTVTNTLRLLRLAQEVQELVEQGELSSGHARALAGLESPKVQLELAVLTMKNGWSVRELEKRVAEATRGPEKGKTEAPKAPQDPNVRAAVLEMERALGTRVKIQGDEKRGKIEISYFSAEDLNRLYEWIVRH